MKPDNQAAPALIEHAEFKPCEWPYNPEYAKKCVCYVMKIPRGKVYLQANTPHLNFTVSCGHDSDRSFSGCFFGHEGVTPLEAMNILARRKALGQF